MVVFFVFIYFFIILLKEENGADGVIVRKTAQGMAGIFRVIAAPLMYGERTSVKIAEIPVNVAAKLIKFPQDVLLEFLGILKEKGYNKFVSKNYENALDELKKTKSYKKYLKEEAKRKKSIEKRERLKNSTFGRLRLRTEDALKKASVKCA